MFAVGGNGESPAVKLNAWQNVPLTPGRIPSFYVPPKLHLSVSPRFRKPKDSDEYQLLPPCSPEKSSPGSGSPVSPRFPFKLRFTPRSNRKRLEEDESDPFTKAAMSLKHVEKITTPYGFRTLAASPNVSRRESLFHRRRGEEGCQSPVFSPAFPELRDSPMSDVTGQNDKPSPEPCSAQKAEKKRLQMIFRKTRVALKSLTPRSRKNHVRKVQDVL
ncbi:C2 calcium-dependent domain-containing protein 4C-like [Hemibagrus wyckioides]|uniref:C2 calcium-dependent domain-containing protein 4C-like n=1 Tax=Hemibagrus wyckioides TaxID=337641 RepID=UPI00266B81BD|nr:C2 calcium-dependent domain-containing protein 4C-like [Hemibagrus wyckioides]